MVVAALSEYQETGRLSRHKKAAPVPERLFPAPWTKEPRERGPASGSQEKNSTGERPCQGGRAQNLPGAGLTFYGLSNALGRRGPAGPLHGERGAKSAALGAEPQAAGSRLPGAPSGGGGDGRGAGENPTKPLALSERRGAQGGREETQAGDQPGQHSTPGGHPRPPKRILRGDNQKSGHQNSRYAAHGGGSPPPEKRRAGNHPTATAAAGEPRRPGETDESTGAGAAAQAKTSRFFIQ